MSETSESLESNLVLLRDTGKIDPPTVVGGNKATQNAYSFVSEPKFVQCGDKDIWDPQGTAQSADGEHKVLSRLDKAYEQRRRLVKLTREKILVVSVHADAYPAHRHAVRRNVRGLSWMVARLRTCVRTCLCECCEHAHCAHLVCLVRTDMSACMQACMLDGLSPYGRPAFSPRYVPVCRHARMCSRVCVRACVRACSWPVRAAASLPYGLPPLVPAPLAVGLLFCWSLAGDARSASASYASA
eukprot:6186846-Pleurochrysis_carterae.AAC.1